MMSTHKEMWKWQWHEEVDSTNALASRAVLEQWNAGQHAENAIIAARRQTAGRGQHGRAWESPIGGLYMSAIVEDVPAGLRERLALIAGAAAADALRELDFAPMIRWPNDLLLNGKKVAGILCEAVAQGDKWASIIGIGVNVNVVTFSPELQPAATSLQIERGQTRRMEDVAQKIAEQLFTWLERARREGLAPVVAHVAARDALRGRQVRLNQGGQTVLGVGEGFDATGALRLRMADGNVRAFATGSLVPAEAVA